MYGLKVLQYFLSKHQVRVWTKLYISNHRMVMVFFFLFKWDIPEDTAVENIVNITGARDTEFPLFKLFVYISIFNKNFFIISSLFPYFNLFMSIFIQSNVNSTLHVSTLCILFIKRGVIPCHKRLWEISEGKKISLIS